jgi:putative DNA primase/helicase
VPKKSVRPKRSLPDGYIRQGDGGIYYRSNEESSALKKLVGPVYCVARTRDSSGANWGILLEWVDSDYREHRWAMPMELLAGDGMEIRAKLLSGGCYVAMGSSERRKLMELFGTIEIEGRATAVEHVGWTSGAFVLPHKTIGDTPERPIIYQGTDLTDHAYRSAGGLVGWQEGVAVHAIGNSRLALTLAAAFVGPLLALLGEEGGGINLRGPSSIGKSTILFAAASVWGSPDYVRQWRATSNGLEGACVLHSGSLLCLDELAQLDPREARFVAYMIANGSGKARAGRSGALRSSAKWRVFFLSTGEISLADLAGRDVRGAKHSGAGQEVRILDVEADAGAGLGIFEYLHNAPAAEALARQIKEASAMAYGLAGPEFVERMIPSRDDHIATTKQRIAKFMAEHLPPGADGQVVRAARRFALVAAAGELAVNLGVLPWPESEATTACSTMFKQWLAGRGGPGAAEDREAVARVRGFLEMHGSSRFEPFDDIGEMPRIINRAGFWRTLKGNREYLFFAETWKTEVCSGMDAGRAAKVLADLGYLRRDSAGKNSITVTLPGIGKTRCYVVSASIFDSDASV